MTEVKEAPKPKTSNGPGQTREMAPQAPTVPVKTNGRPFAFMRRFAEEMDQLFENFGLETGWLMPSWFTQGRERVRREVGFVPTDWSPRVDVLEREGQWVVHAELPGLGKEEVKVEVTHDLLTIQGERKEEQKAEREGYHYRECRYGSFFRAIPLPEGVDTMKATADFNKGVLEVVMPYVTRPEQHVRRLEVREAK